jgi:hypothetical protein
MLKYTILIMAILYSAVSFAGDNDGIMKIKSGAEERSLSCLAAEEFSEDNYAGEYVFGPDKCLVIEDDRARSGHLILRADCMGLRCTLHRFNRFIYVYGPSPDSPEPVLGSVTFLSDGDHVNQVLWQHGERQAFFPTRR